MRGAAATKQSRSVRICELLRDTLELWRVQGTVTTRGDAIVVHAGAAPIEIQRAADGPFRWLLTADGRQRPCTSVLGVLNALRRALDVDRGAPLRIA